jgi:hypothetical protein
VLAKGMDIDEIERRVRQALEAVRTQTEKVNT